jgi:hypothetical protein
MATRWRTCWGSNKGNTMTQLDRIESKVDALTAAIAALVQAMADDGGDDDGPLYVDLEGNGIPGDRDQNEPL